MNIIKFNKLIQFRGVLLRHNLQRAHIKAEFLNKLAQTTSSGQWLQCANVHGVTEAYQESSDNVNANPTPGQGQTLLSSDPATYELLQKEIEAIRKEKDLISKELQLLKEENEHLRQSTGSEERSDKLKEIHDLVDDFSGRNDLFQGWKHQILFLCTMYKLDDSSAKLLISSKLKGKALTWLFSKPDYINMNLNDLLTALEEMFDSNEDNDKLRRKFEARHWVKHESFRNYFLDKVIMGNKLLIDGYEMLDCLIDGIPDTNLRNQARLQNFESKFDLLEAFKNKKLGDNNLSITREYSNDTKPSKSDYLIRCYKCNEYGHRAAECKSGIEGKVCYKCFQLGHIARDCPSNIDVGTQHSKTIIK